MLLTQAPRVNFQCRFSYRVQTAPVCNHMLNICAHIKLSSTGSYTTVWLHKIKHILGQPRKTESGRPSGRGIKILHNYYSVGLSKTGVLPPLRGTQNCAFQFTDHGWHTEGVLMLTTKQIQCFSRQPLSCWYSVAAVF